MLDRSLYSFAERRGLRFSYCFLCAALAAFTFRILSAPKLVRRRSRSGWSGPGAGQQFLKAVPRAASYGDQERNGMRQGLAPCHLKTFIVFQRFSRFSQDFF